MFRFSFHKSDSEERLLQRLQQGDTSAAEPLYRLHVRYLSALCSRYLTDDEDIKDVLQESFLRIFSSIDSFEYRGKGSLRGWMAKIALNETLKFLRARSRLDFVDISDLPHDVPDTDLQTEGISQEVRANTEAKKPKTKTESFLVFISLFFIGFLSLCLLFQPI